MFSTRLLAANEDVPFPRPVQCTVVPVNDANVAPATVTILIFPDVAVVNDTVAMTDASFLTRLDRTTEGSVRIPALVSLIMNAKHVRMKTVAIFILF